MARPYFSRANLAEAVYECLVNHKPEGGPPAIGLELDVHSHGFFPRKYPGRRPKR